MSPLPRELVQIYQRFTEMRWWTSAPGTPEGRSKYRCLAPRGGGVRGADGGVRITCEDFLAARPVKRKI